MSLTKTEWIKAVSSLLKEYPELIPKGGSPKPEDIEKIKHWRGKEYCFVIKDKEEPQDDSLDLYDQEQHRAAAEARGCV